MGDKEYRWALAQWVLEIWNPDRYLWVENPKRKRRVSLFCRAHGIVMHDRALNGERLVERK